MLEKSTSNPVTDYIYALIHKHDGKDIVFYIGRTIDPHRRLNEHKNGAKNYQTGDEDKYEYASTLNSLGIKWEMKILQECGANTENFEDYYVNLFRSDHLMNMKQGDDAPWMGRNYKSIEDFIETRTKLIEKAKNKIKTKKVSDSDPDKMIFSFEDPNKKFMSAGLAHLLQKRILR